MTGAEGPAPRVRPYLVPGDAIAPGELATDDETPRALLRPYQLTGGRTVPVDPALPIEAQVVALPTGKGAGALGFEHREVLSAAHFPVSVAELGALLHVHLQVVRVLVADLAAAGHLRVLAPQPATATDPGMIERVIRGLTNLT
jgi:hypothetical protein